MYPFGTDSGKPAGFPEPWLLSSRLSRTKLLIRVIGRSHTELLPCVRTGKRFNTEIKSTGALVAKITA